MNKSFFATIVASAISCGIVRAEVVTGVAVVVTDAVITQGEVDSDWQSAAPTVARRFPNDAARYQEELEKIRDNSLEQRVENKLILHDFSSGGYNTNIVEPFIDDLIRQTIQKEYGGDRGKFIKTQLAMGVTYAMYRRRLREDVIISQMKHQNASDLHKIIISPLKIEEYYEAHKDDFKVDDQIKLRIIVVPQSSDDPPDTAKKMAGEILAKINSGVPFAQMAMVNSAGSQRAEGGDRGWIDRNYLNPALSKIAFSLKAGQRSGVIEQPEACYIIQVDDVRSSHVRELKDVRREIEDTLRLSENRRLHELWIKRLKNKSYVQYY